MLEFIVSNMLITLLFFIMVHLVVSNHIKMVGLTGILSFKIYNIKENVYDNMRNIYFSNSHNKVYFFIEASILMVERTFFKPWALARS